MIPRRRQTLPPRRHTNDTPREGRHALPSGDAHRSSYLSATKICTAFHSNIFFFSVAWLNSLVSAPSVLFDFYTQGGGIDKHVAGFLFSLPLTCRYLRRKSESATEERNRYCMLCGSWSLRGRGGIDCGWTTYWTPRSGRDENSRTLTHLLWSMLRALASGVYVLCAAATRDISQNSQISRHIGRFHSFIWYD